MEQLAIQCGIRTQLSKGARNRIRREGGGVGVLFGRDVEATPIFIDPASFKKIAAHNGYGLVELKIDGMGRYNAIIHHIEREPLTRKIIHIDFHAVALDKPVDVEVPLHIVGGEKVEKQGGVVQQQLRELMVRSLPIHVPEQVTVDISHLTAGETLHAGQIQLPEPCTLKTNPDEVIVTIITAKNAPPETEIEPKEPELVHDTEGQGVGAHSKTGGHE